MVDRVVDPVADALAGLDQLTKARDRQTERVRQEQDRLSQIDKALKALQGQILVTSHPIGDYAGLGITEAAKRWLLEVGAERTTNEIAEAILARGLITKSKNFIPAVYATLRNSKEFVRKADKWDLKKRLA